MGNLLEQCCSSKRRDEIEDDEDTPESYKLAGNKAFGAKEFHKAIKLYTKAIMASQEKPCHIYFANRANASLQLKRYAECISDCNTAININPLFIKSYIRKCNALICESKLDEAE